jgi:hypothetical protein
MSPLLDVPTCMIKFGDDPAISSGVIAFFCFQFWHPGGKAKNQTGPKFGLSYAAVNVNSVPLPVRGRRKFDAE